MKSIAFFDLEVQEKTGKVLDYGAVYPDGRSLHTGKRNEFVSFIKDADYLCGHNIIKHDIRFIAEDLEQSGKCNDNYIDTLLLSPLLFPLRPYHRLIKDDKLQADEQNNPLSDSRKAMEAFLEETDAFNHLSDSLKSVYYQLLGEIPGFKGFFGYMNYFEVPKNLEQLINEYFLGSVCENVILDVLIKHHPNELAYALALINTRDKYSIIPPWVHKNYPDVDRIMYLLRSKRCLKGCIYCNSALDAMHGLKKHFGFDQFRVFEGEPLQENAVETALRNESLLAVFPTGGGKSITFQLPALMAGENTRGLTVVISPLQSLMKDQVDNLEKHHITDAVTINGLLDPIERAKSIERVEDGSASILYISPESLRSKTIEKIILGRHITRFVIDEAHCFSSWGQDFRVDYMYIGDFIKSIQEQKNLKEPIPVSCFTATAKQKVISDIVDYFREKLAIELKMFISKSSRTNLTYKVFSKTEEAEKYNALRDLIEQKKCPTIVYVSRTKKANVLAEHLRKDGFSAKAFHGKMDVHEKTANQNAFISGKVQIMVATSAFGMGVDKKDVGLVVHFEISDSLENYVQEAGRAGRDEKITADCYVLFNEEDLNKHFLLLNQTKLSINEIKQVWKAIKANTTRVRSKVSKSALELARDAGWDEDVREIETRITTAIAALEDAGYVKRGQNMPRVFASSILCKTAQEAIDKINASVRFSEKQKVTAVRIMKKLVSSRSRKQATDEVAESRIDYISDHLGIVRDDVIEVINLLREEKILADSKDMTAFIKTGDRSNKLLQSVESFAKIEFTLLEKICEGDGLYSIKDLNEFAESKGCSSSNPGRIKTLLNIWAIKNWIKREVKDENRNYISIRLNHDKRTVNEHMESRNEIAKYIIGELHKKAIQELALSSVEKEEVMVEFSVLELCEGYKRSYLNDKATSGDIEDALFYLNKTGVIKMEGGFLVLYNRLSVERLEKNNLIQYKDDDYAKLKQFYKNRIEQIHIVGEYARKMLENYNEALVFVDDYFKLNYNSFLRKYFGGERLDEIRRSLTPEKYRKLFWELSIEQLGIVNDQSARVLVAAGPGSGKTRVLVHKLASLLLMEDTKTEQLLMLTFSRAAANEFKKRLLALIGNAAAFVEIRTFHSYCFDLVGKTGCLEQAENIISIAIERIRNDEIEKNRIAKTVMVIDEAQDINKEEYALVSILMEQNPEMRVIAVGDDDQNIYEFRGSDSKYFIQLLDGENVAKHELVRNYRSRANLVEFTNGYLKYFNSRLKKNTIIPFDKKNGKIRIIKYKGNNLHLPLANGLLNADLAGTTCVLTRTNDEASVITGYLNSQNCPAKLIQSNDGFSLYNLYEVRLFMRILDEFNRSVLDDETWLLAKQKLCKALEKSAKLEICSQLFKEFESITPYKKFKSDFEEFVRESRIEDFIHPGSEQVTVSTMHKAKGKEFDNVYIMLENYIHDQDDARRVLYVAMTRAKQNLTIHMNGSYLDDIFASDTERSDDGGKYELPSKLILNLSYGHVHLGYFPFVQKRFKSLYSGVPLKIHADGLANSEGDLIIKFSKGFIDILASHRELGYTMTEAKVNYLLYWKGKDAETEVLIALPEITLEKKQ